MLRLVIWRRVGGNHDVLVDMLRFGRSHHGCDDTVVPVLLKNGLEIASWGSANDRHALILRVLRLENAEPMLVVERDGGLCPGL